MPKSDPHARFYDREDLSFEADSCEPLKAAAARGEVQLSAWGHGRYPGQSFPAELLPEVRSAGVWNATRQQRWGLDEHCNEGLEFSFIERGKLGYSVADATWELHSGHLTISRPWQLHRVGNPRVAASRFHWLILDVGVRRPNQVWHWPDWLVLSERDLERLTRLLRHNETPVWRANADLARCFKQLARTLELRDPEQVAARIKLHVNTMLVSVLELLEGQDIPLDEGLTSSQRAVQLFLARLPDQLETPWTLNEMSEVCGLGRSRFAAYCTQVTNMSPIEYLTHCRLERAARLLHAEPQLPITDIGFQCGFRSSQYFTNSFRARHGCSPRAYRAARG